MHESKQLRLLEALADDQNRVLKGGLGGHIHADVHAAFMGIMKHGSIMVTMQAYLMTCMLLGTGQYTTSSYWQPLKPCSMYEAVAVQGGRTLLPDRR